MKKLVKKIKIKKELEIVTGLHIGGNSDNVEIGGIDNPVIKTKDGKPYIPGSSLKGKMRCLLEQVRGCELSESPEVNNMFGCPPKEQEKDAIPSKIIVRDAFLTKESVEKLLESEYMEMPYTEAKSENTIDRLEATSNPRTMERIPAGVRFGVEFILNIWDNDDENAMKEMLDEAIRLLENDYLGGSGSRGYGQVIFIDINTPTELSADNNWGRK